MSYVYPLRVPVESLSERWAPVGSTVQCTIEEKNCILAIGYGKDPDPEPQKKKTKKKKAD